MFGQNNVFDVVDMEMESKEADGFGCSFVTDNMHICGSMEILLEMSMHRTSSKSDISWKLRCACQNSATGTLGLV